MQFIPLGGKAGWRLSHMIARWRVKQCGEGERGVIRFLKVKAQGAHILLQIPPITDTGRKQLAVATPHLCVPVRKLG